MDPELAEVLQEDDTYPAVRVRVCEPIQVNELPARVMHSRSISVTNVATSDSLEIIGSEDLRRKWMFVSTTGQPVFIGPDKQAVLDGIAGILPVGGILPLPTGTPLYVRAAAVGTAVVSYWAGYWAD